MSSKRKFDAQGKAALFSGSEPPRGPVTIECSTCDASTQVGITELARNALPLNFTIPLRYYHTWMRCPACKNRTWVHLKLGE